MFIKGKYRTRYIYTHFGDVKLLCKSSAFRTNIETKDEIMRAYNLPPWRVSVHTKRIPWIRSAA